jgi:hypothetical protein
MYSIFIFIENIINSMFNRSHREKSEPCVVAQENKVNSAIASYITKNDKLSAKDVSKTALSEPQLLFSDGHVAPEGIEVASTLRFGSVGNLNEPQSLCARSNVLFYESSDLKDVSAETKLRNGTAETEKRSEEVKPQPNVFVPQIPSVKDNVQNPKNIIPEMSSESFTRFGVSTRLNKAPIKR